MKKAFLLLAAVVCSVLAGCASGPSPSGTKAEVGDAGIGFGYYPLDPMPVKTTVTDKAAVLKLLPDETIRMAIGEELREGGITFGPARTGVANRSYVVIVDYMKYTTQVLPAKTYIDSTTRKKLAVLSPKAEEVNASVPIYIGIGLRMTASIRVLKGEVDLGNLFSLGAAAKAEQISGQLIVQNMGIGSRTTTDLLPMPSSITDSSIQAAIVALSAIKAKVYDAEDPVPRVLGIYNTLGGTQETINMIIGDVLLNAPAFPPGPGTAKTSQTTQPAAGAVAAGAAQ